MADVAQRNHRALRVVETFLGEAAVLLAVFPILDEFVQRGPEGVTWRLVVASIASAALLLAGAVILAVFFDKEVE